MNAARALLVLALCALAAPAHAGPFSALREAVQRWKDKRGPKQARPNRAHLLTPHLVQHLKPETRQNVSALAGYYGKTGSGSGVVVGMWPGRREGRVRALVLTNHHVVDDNHDQNAMMSFMDGTTVSHTKVVAKSRLLDYALLEVTLPDDTAIVPSKLELGMAQQGDSLYALGEATSMKTYDVHKFLSVGRKEARQLRRWFAREQIIQHPIISTGYAFSDGPQMERLSAPGWPGGSHRALLQIDNLPNAPGSSGGPVYSATTHGLKGLVTAGEYYKGAGFRGLSTSLELITHDIAKKYNRGLINPYHHDTVHGLLETVYPQAQATQ